MMTTKSSLQKSSLQKWWDFKLLKWFLKGPFETVYDLLLYSDTEKWK